MMRARGVMGSMVRRAVAGRVAVMMPGLSGVAVVMPRRGGGVAVAMAPGVVALAVPAVGGVAVASVAALSMMGGVGGRGHRGVPGHMVGIVERVGRVAIGIVLGGGRAGDGEQDAGEGGQLGEGEFHGRSQTDGPL